MLIQNAELADNRIAHVRSRRGVVTEIDEQLLPTADETVIDARAGVLLPGLHDHHMHLYALAATRSSVLCGPPEVNDVEALAQALAASPGGDWIRGIGYHDSVAGELTRWQLDQLISDRPVRIQHRSGKMWMVNSVAAEILELDSNNNLAGIERDCSGRANGRLFRLDHWLRSKLASQSPPDLASVSQQLASFGVTGLTDASPSNSGAEVELFTHAVSNGQLLQRVLMMGDLALPVPSHQRVSRGAYKILLDEHHLPEFDSVIGQMVSAHQQRRPVAVHCVTRTELVFALSAMMAAGHLPGDRIEHASVATDEAIKLMQQAQVAVVTQHGFISQRGDQYLQDVNPGHHALLYRGKAFLNAGLPLAGSSDAPYGLSDPWLTMRAAVDRTTSSGQYIGVDEKLSPEQALALFTSKAEQPGSVQRKIAVGQVADFCLLDRSWASARLRLDSADVAATIVDGELIYSR